MPQVDNIQALEIRLRKHLACLSAKIGSERDRARELSSATEMEWTCVFFFFFSLKHLVQLMLLPCCAAWLLNAESQCEYAESSVLRILPARVAAGFRNTCLGLGIGLRVFVSPAVRKALPVDRRLISFFSSPRLISSLYTRNREAAQRTV